MDEDFEPMMDRNGRNFVYCVDCFRYEMEDPDQAMCVWFGDSLCKDHLRKRMARPRT